MSKREYEDVLSIVGNYGRSQKQDILFILIPVALVMAFTNMNIIFMVSTPDHWCREPSLEVFNMTPDERRTILRPIVEVGGFKKPDKCHMYNLTDLIANSNTKEDLISNAVSKRPLATTTCINGWEFDQSNYKATVSTKWNLVCKNSNWVPTIYGVSALGTAAGTIVYNFLSDRFGRKPIFLVVLIALIVGQAALVCFHSFLGFLIVKFLLATTTPSAYQIPYLIIMENVGPDMRARINGLFSLVWTFGLMLKPLSAYLTADWVLYGWVSFAVTVPLITYFRFLPESNRWLIARGRYEEAADRLMTIAQKNSKNVSYDHLLQTIKEAGESKIIPHNKISLANLMRFKKTFLRLIMMSIIWNSTAMNYYGFHINVANLAGNEFLNFFLLAIVEIPSHLLGWCMMQSRLGRRWTAVLLFAMVAFSNFIPLMAGSVGLVATIASLIGKFGVSAAFTAVYQITTEIFPTSIRASCIGIASTITAILGVFTPQIVYASKYGRYIPYIVFGCLCLVSAFTAAFLPETLNVYLPQTLQDSETFFSGQKFFSLASKTMQKPRAAKAEPLLQEQIDLSNTKEGQQTMVQGV